MKTIDDIKDVNKLINNYKDLCGQRSIICDIPLNSLKCIAKILTNFKSNVSFLRSDIKDMEYIERIEYYLKCIKGGQGWKGYKRASKYITVVEDCLNTLK